MGKQLLSVGLDVGTTTTQLVFSRLWVQNRGSAFTVPRMEITHRQTAVEKLVSDTIRRSELIEALKDIPGAANGSATTLAYENGHFRLLEYSREDYMGALVTKLPENV